MQKKQDIFTDKRERWSLAKWDFLSASSNVDTYEPNAPNCRDGGIKNGYKNVHRNHKQQDNEKHFPQITKYSLKVRLPSSGLRVFVVVGRGWGGSSIGRSAQQLVRHVVRIHVGGMRGGTLCPASTNIHLH